ncbi:hypothetical protein J1614_004440 [Plenodomus biglobosus]|nr:hypothetical protein J1614_004440 [Plenodomus biglobosus]
MPGYAVSVLGQQWGLKRGEEHRRGRRGKSADQMQTGEEQTHAWNPTQYNDGPREQAGVHSVLSSYTG